MKGAAVCVAHGGAAPQVRRKAAERLAAHEALGELARRGVTPVDNPLSALASLAGEILAAKDVFRERVSRLQEEAWRYQDAKGGEQLRAELAMYERALDRSARVLADIARLKIDERLTAITEQQGQALAAVIVAVLDRLDLGERAGQVRELVAVELERLAA
ncbi:hypothetical protein [Nonomuraea sp. SBT364]|uniref:hypothetical protein n=1 Tax=Nonomuraea sp. SBT364 TaxID=1580530 RepID=UPI00066B1AB7|nr:hypothetical protein [Nonomuraea sp. SBT364]